MKSPLFCLAPVVLALVVSSAGAEALETAETADTAWIPIAASGTPNTKNLPLWIRSVEFDPVGRSFLGENAARFRVRFPETAPTGEELLVRLIFDDLPSARPVISAWDEIGNEIARSEPLGSGTGLPASETVIVAVDGANYLEIEIPGNGKTLHGVFLSRVEQKVVRESVDFANKTAWEEPFKGKVPIPPSGKDSLLYGTVTATVLNETVKLGEKFPPSVVVEFELQRRPLVALVTFEVLNASIEEPVVLQCNRRPMGSAAYQLPDLADPAYRGTVRPLIDGMRFQYAGWLTAQKLLPGGTLKAGVNELRLTLPKGLDPVAIRAVQVQLKYFWEKIDYEVRP